MIKHKSHLLHEAAVFKKFSKNAKKAGKDKKGE